MDKAAFIRVKFKFGAKCKLAKLDRTADKNFSSMENLTKLIFKHFPEIEEMVQERPPSTMGVLAPAQRLTVKCKDMAGDYITLENEDDLEAMELSKSNNLEFSIDVNPMLFSFTTHTPSRYHDRSTEMSSNRNSDRKPAGNSANKAKLSQTFQSGNFSKFGESCQFSPDPTERDNQNLHPSNPPAESLDSVTVQFQQPDSRSMSNAGRAYDPDRRAESSLYMEGVQQPASRYMSNGGRAHPNPRVESSQSSTKGQQHSGRSTANGGRTHPNLRAESSQSSTHGFQQRYSRFAARQEGDYMQWLSRRAVLDSATNMEYLSGEEGRRVLSSFVKERNLPHDSITLFVKLLAREEIRTSLLRQKTNKIYGILIGSPFLLRLDDHIVNHLGLIPTLKPQNVRPYLALIEELQSRTRDGWKEVPLNALKSVVSNLTESSAKEELLARVSHLADQSERVQRLLAVDPTEKHNSQGEEFRNMSIVPCKEELVEFQGKQKLPVNRIGIQYSGVSEYLGTHFRLLREDCIDPLRQAIKAYRSTCANNNKFSKGKARHSQTSALLDVDGLRIYLGVQLAGVRCDDTGVEFVLSFQIPESEKTVEKWESSKKLMNGALLCISSDDFHTFFWGVVGRRDVKELAEGRVTVRIIGESNADVASNLHNGQPSNEAYYVMVESTASYFEAYYHVLKTLQREEMEHIPFTPYLLHLEPRVKPPSYLLQRIGEDLYDFSCAFPDMLKKLGRKSFRVMQPEWPTGWADSLDRAQQDALKQGLTKELAIIQGPPGTGKTFLGLLLVKILLANLSHRPSNEINQKLGRQEVEMGEDIHDLSGPILIICYTNHALDQFLEGIYRDGQTSIIRIGGRSKGEMLKNNTLQSLLVKQREEQAVKGSHRRLYGRSRFEKDELESKIHNCIDAMAVKLVTETMLDGIATCEQRQSLFWIGFEHNRSSKETVKLWLTEARPHLAQHFVTINLEDEELDEDSDEEFATIERKPADRGKKSRGAMKLLPKAESHQDDDWVQVRRGGRGGRRQRTDNGNGGLDIEGGGVDNGPHRNVADIADGGPIEEEIRWATDVWQLTLPQRRKLHAYWLQEKRKLDGQKLRMLTEEYEEACRALKEVDNEISLSMLRTARIVGMTTTGAAKHHDVLKSLKPEIVIVEEAAEVLEGHILACINPSVKHLILIGDHLQLRPSVAVYDLALKHKLDVSMFERLVKSGVEHVTLQEQRRMRPNISKLVRSLYPGSRDHESVAQYDDVKGVKSNVFFFDHKAEEDNSSDTGSKVNSTEAELVVELCLYLLNQGCYKAENIAILAMYTGQLQEIKKLLRPRIHNRFSVKPTGILPSEDSGQEDINLLPRVSSVDDYQGEESDIIILSLVRSNAIVTKGGVGKIGFLNISNRICVALTRARKGMYVFGNADLLSEKNTLWKDVTSSMRNSGELGPELELYCQNHPEIITRIATADDFKQVEDGGCSLPCEYQLDCGHACSRRCHPGSHDLIVCPKPCSRRYDECRHTCPLRCHGSEACRPCRVIVTKQMQNCKHEQGVECSKNVSEEPCRSVCEMILRCAHRCRMLCGRPCTEQCTEIVVKILPCGHSTKMQCHEDPKTYSCGKPCRAILQGCEHRCQGSCGKCQRGAAHIPCQQKCLRTLPCGHLCEDGCSKNCPPCLKKCRKRCFHSRCSERCGILCRPCREPCSWQCEHHKCDKSCHEICTRPRCDRPCPKLIPKCGHPCIGLCGEPCPTKCRVCHLDLKDIITQMTLEEYEESDRFIQLEDCKHVFEVSGLDNWMDSDEVAQREDGSTAIKLKECPECRSVVWKTHRYSNVVKKKHSQVEDVKKMMFGHEQTRRGNLLLEQGDLKGSELAFRQALQQNPSLVEAHFGIGCAFFARADYATAIAHLSFVVERSLFASSLGRYIKSARKIHALDDMYYNSSLSSSRASASIAMQAIVQWASAQTHNKEFTIAIELCDTVLATDPENRLAKDVKEKAKKGEVQLVVQAMATEVGGHGHWYTCPNGHYYTIGECGGATHLSKCPDCKADIGGGQHRLTAGNRHSNIDGSERSAWPGNY